MSVASNNKAQYKDVIVKKILCLTTLAISLSLGHASFVFADHEMRGLSEHGLEKIVHKLDLTPDQKAKIQTIVDQARKDRMPKFLDIKNIEMQMNDVVKSPTFDEAKIDDLINQEKDVLGTTIKIRIMEKHDIYAVLTDAQKAKLDEMIQEWKKKHDDKHHID